MSTQTDENEKDIQARFEDVRQRFQEEFDRLKTDAQSFTPYYENTKKIDAWLNEKGSHADS